MSEKHCGASVAKASTALAKKERQWKKRKFERKSRRNDSIEKNNVPLKGSGPPKQTNEKGV